MVLFHLEDVRHSFESLYRLRRNAGIGIQPLWNTVLGQRSIDNDICLALYTTGRRQDVDLD